MQEDPCAEDKRAIAVVTKKPNDSEPTGDHNVFSHVPHHPDCEVRRLTKASRARCKHRPVRRAVGIPHPTAFGELATDDDSRDDHRNGVIAQE